MTESTQNTQNEFNRFLRILLKRKWIVLSCVICILLPVIYFTLSSLPVYRATAMIVCEEKTSSIPDLGFQDFTLTSTFVVNQIQEIKSWSMISEVVDVLPDAVFHTFPVPESISSKYNLREYITSIVQKNVSAEAVPKSEVIQIHVEAYEAEAACIIANVIAEKMKGRNINTRLGEIRSVERIIEEQLEHFSRRVEDTEEALRAFKEWNRVTYLDEESVEVFKRITEAEVEYNRIRSEHEAARKRLQFVQGKLTRERNELVPSITRITSPWTQKLKEQLVELEVQYTSLRVQNYSDNHPKMKALKSQIDKTKKNLREETLKIARGEDILDPLSRIEQDLEEIAALEVNIYTYEAQEKALENVLGNYSNLLKGVPEKELELGRLIRDKNVADNIYTMLLNRREETKIQKAEITGNIRIIDPALIPKNPIRPRRKLNIIIGLFLGIIVGVGLALFFESQDTRITTIEDIEKNISFKVLGSIPRIKNGHHHSSHRKIESFKKNHHTKNPLKLLTEFEPKSSAVEAFKTLRTNVRSANSGSELKTILVTSANPREGKSFIASNLAVATAQQGLKTLLIDADLRKPVLHNLFNTDMQPGLIDLLCALSPPGEAPAEIRKALFVFYKNKRRDTRKSFIVSTYIRHLFVITSGMIPPNPSEFLALRSTKELIEKLRNRFDILIFDLPPATEYTDAAVLAQVSDGILFVVNSRKSKMEEVQKAKNSIEKVKEDSIIGAVLNNVHGRNGHYPTNHYYKRYDEKETHRRGNRQRRVIDKTQMRNKRENEAFLNAVRNDIIRHVKGKWLKVARYL